MFSVLTRRHGSLVEQGRVWAEGTSDGELAVPRKYGNIPVHVGRPQVRQPALLTLAIVYLEHGPMTIGKQPLLTLLGPVADRSPAEILATAVLWLARARRARRGRDHRVYPRADRAGLSTRNHLRRLVMRDAGLVTGEDGPGQTVVWRAVAARVARPTSPGQGLWARPRPDRTNINGAAVARTIG